MKNKYFIYKTSFVDDIFEIGIGTKTRNFSHIMSGYVLGKSRNFYQNLFDSFRTIQESYTDILIYNYLNYNINKAPLKFFI